MHPSAEGHVPFPPPGVHSHGARDPACEPLAMEINPAGENKQYAPFLLYIVVWEDLSQPSPVSFDTKIRRNARELT